MATRKKKGIGAMKPPVPKDMLATLFANILIELNVSSLLWDSLMAQYLNDPFNRIPNNWRDRDIAERTLSRMLRRPTMTASNFIIAMRFLQVPHFELTASLYHAKSLMPTHHRVEMRSTRQIS